MELKPLPTDVPELILTRTFDAPRELVWAAWTDPQMLMAWWGPQSWPASQLDMDVRPGGRWRNCLRGVETGEELWQHGVFTVVEPPRRLVFTFVWEDEGERGVENQVTVTFEELSSNDCGARTRMHFHQTPFLSSDERDDHSEGWSSTFDRLDDLLKLKA